MQIKRFKKYPQIGEDAIVKYFNKEIVDFIKRPEFHIANTEVFMFVDKEEVNIIVEEGVDTIIYDITESLMKPTIVEKIKNKDILIFINEGKYPNYVFYGVYRLENPYTIASGVEGPVTKSDVPLKFKLVSENYEIR